MTSTRQEPDLSSKLSQQELLEVKGLTIQTTNGATLVDDVSFVVRRGRMAAIVGESGSGKTLTARSLVGILDGSVHPSGSVTFKGRELIGASSRAWRDVRGGGISMVLQDPFTALNPLQTVGDIVRESLPRNVRGGTRSSRIEIDRRLGEVGLTPEVAKKYPFQLSGGMRQRAAIAAALCRDPELLIADEPTTALDATTQSSIMVLLGRLCRERGMSLILITHDLNLAFSTVDEVLVMYAGRVVETGGASRVAGAPLHPYTYGLRQAEPSVSEFVEQLSSIPGSVPPAASVVSQCAFADRCEWALTTCTDGRVPLAEVEPGHWTDCRRVADINLGDNLATHSKNPERPARRSITFTLSKVTTPPPSSARPYLRVTSLDKTYEATPMLGRKVKHKAVDGASFTIDSGESLGLLGETGSGKTTIARCLLGLERPDSGVITMDGTDITNRGELTRRQREILCRQVQVVFQNPYAALNPALTIGSALEEAARTSREQRWSVNELLDLVGLPEATARVRPSLLSGGQRQRVAIARAIATRPKLLICDEPVAALDVSVQSQILELLRSIRAELGMSMLFITHDLAVARQMTERAIILRHGLVLEEGTTADILDSPQHAYTVALVAAAKG